MNSFKLSIAVVVIAMAVTSAYFIVSPYAKNASGGATAVSVVATTTPVTLDLVATHASVTSCWTVIAGKVYDLTSFIAKHPGGEGNILKICGKDGTAAFGGQHGGSQQPEDTLTDFYYAPLQN